MKPQQRSELIDMTRLASLRDEIGLLSALNYPQWTAVHSHYYFDLRDKVWRELDVVATSSWLGKIRDLSVRIRVLILIESKGLSKKHILLPEVAPLRQGVLLDWLGSHQRKDVRLSVYRHNNLEQDIAQRLDSNIFLRSAAALPGAPGILKPPPATEWNAAGFAEAANGKKSSSENASNELGSSVLWRTRLALQSAARALAQKEIDISARLLQVGIGLAQLKQLTIRNDKFDFLKEVDTQLKGTVFTINIFHPLVVLDADLWGVSSSKTQEVTNARIHLADIEKFPYFWLDIVKRERADSVLGDIQSGYESQAFECGLLPEAPDRNVSKYEIVQP